MIKLHCNVNSFLSRKSILDYTPVSNLVASDLYKADNKMVRRLPDTYPPSLYSSTNRIPLAVLSKSHSFLLFFAQHENKTNSILLASSRRLKGITLSHL